MPEPAARPADPLNALTDEDVRIAGTPGGPLSGLTFVVKDLYDVAGYRTVAGSPAWAAVHGPAASTSPVVARLLDAGADLVAKSHTDELAWSLLGENAHFGTPTNPRTPDRVPGGSSSGSVVAVASGMVDFAVGSDTGGSVRVPASNCGVYGIRTSYGAISLAHAVPLAPSFDTVGWFARDAEMLERVGRTLLSGTQASGNQGAALATDAFAVADETVTSTLRPVAHEVSALAGGALETALSSTGLADWASAWRTIQAREVWKVHGAWVDEHDPAFGPGIRERFEWARTVDADEERGARAVQASAQARLREVFGDVGLVLVPAVPSVAPRLDATAEELEEYRTRAMMLTCAAGLCELPQITVPAGEAEGCPVGLGVIGPHGSDLELLALACRHAASRGPSA